MVSLQCVVVALNCGLSNNDLIIRPVHTFHATSTQALCVESAPAGGAVLVWPRITLLLVLYGSHFVSRYTN